MNPPTQTIILRQGELESTTLSIAIYEDGDAFDLADHEAQFMAALPNGKVIIDPCTKTGVNMLTYTLPAAITAQMGTITLAYVAISKDNEWIASTDCLTIQVKPGVDIEADVAEDVLGHFAGLKKQLDQLIEQANKQTEDQQSAWEEQMGDQADAFDAAEALRDKEEAKRVAAESARSTAEAARVKAEAGRVSAENARVQAESARSASESARVKAEADRASAETARANAEKARTAAEKSRADAESARAAAEKARAAAETGRVAAEKARVEAEKKREEAVADAIDKMLTLDSISNEEIDALWT